MSLLRDIQNAAIDTDADVIVLLTRWAEFKRLPDILRTQKRKVPVVVDGRRLFDKGHVENYEGIGLGDRNLAGGHEHL